MRFVWVAEPGLRPDHQVKFAAGGNRRAGTHGFRDGLVGRLKVETLWIELLAGPAAHGFVLFMLGSSHASRKSA
jgi:hypothetical protein